MNDTIFSFVFSIIQNISTLFITTKKIRTKICKVIAIFGFFICSTVTIESTYNVGTLDTTANEGTGFGNATPAIATGYTSYSAGGIDLDAKDSAIQPDGKIVVVGSWDTTSGLIVRYNINGTLDTTFDTDGAVYITLSGRYTDVQATGVAIQQDGKIVVVGNCTNTAGPVPAYFIARYNSDGTLDTSNFTASGYIVRTSGVSAYVNAVTIQPDDQKIIVAGTTTFSGDGFNFILVVRYNTDGTIDDSFDGNGYAHFYAPGTVATPHDVQVDVNGKIVLVGSVDNEMMIVRYTSIGGLDNSFNSSGHNELQFDSLTTSAYALAFQSTGKIIVSGTVATQGIFIARFTTGGLIDNTANDPSDPFATDGYFTDQLGSTAGVSTGCIVQDDDKIVIGGYATNNSLIQYIMARYEADGSALDTVFGTNGYTLTDISNPSYAHTLSLQQNGSFILAGTIATGDTQFSTARYLGNQGIQGCMDISYNPAIGTSPGTPGFFLNPIGGTSAEQPCVIGLQALDNNTVFVVGNFGGNGQLVKLDVDGTALTDVLTIDQDNVVDIIVDTQGRALVVGVNATDGTTATLGRYVIIDDVLQPDPDFYSSLSVMINDKFANFQRVGILSNGTIIAMGQKLQDPAYCGLVEYYQHGKLKAETTLSAFIGTDLLIAGNDKIYVAGQVDAGNIIINSYFNGVNSIDTGWVVANCGAPSMAFDTDENIIICAVDNDTGNVAFEKYSSDTTLLTSDIITQSTTFLLNPVITRLQCDTNNRPVFTGYDDCGPFVGRLVFSEGEYMLDTIFAPYATVPGLLKTKYNDNNSVSHSFALGIAPSGAILYGGYEEISTSNLLSFVGQVVGETGVGQNPRFQEAVPGDFDNTYGDHGVAETYADGASSATDNQQVKAISQFPVGTNIMTIVSDDINAWTVKLLGDGTNDPEYGGGLGIAITQLAGHELVNGMIFDGVGNLIVFGSNDVSGGYVKSILPTGSENPIFGGYTGDPRTIFYPVGTAYGLMTTVNAVGQLSDGQFVIVGNENGVGKVMMLSSTGIPSSTFGLNGSVISGTNINSVSVDSDNNLYMSVGYFESDLVKNVRFLKLSASGRELLKIDNVLTDVNFAETDKLVINTIDQIIIAASGNQDTGQILLTRLNEDGSVDDDFNNGDVVSINFAGSTTAMVSSLVTLKEEEQILIAGFLSGDDVGSNYELVVCLNYDGILDDTFNPNGATPGILQFQVASDPQAARAVWNMTVQYDGKILLAGSEDSVSDDPADGNTSLTMRLYGYDNLYAVSQFPGYTPTVEDRVNPFFGDAGYALIDGIDELAHGGDIVIDSQGRSIIGGRIIINNAFVVTRFLPSGLYDPSFGTEGVSISVEIPTLMSGSFVTVDSNDDILISGITSDSTFILAKFSGVDGSQITADFGTTGIAESTPITNLDVGGSVRVGTDGNIVVGGKTLDSNLVVARFSEDGTLDTNFNAPNGFATVEISDLLNGGNVVTSLLHDVYIAGATLTNKMVVAKFDSAGVLDTSGFGVSGIATTSEILGFVDGGVVALDNVENIILGGYSLNQTFMIAKFSPLGIYDTSFGGGAIVFSNPIGKNIDAIGSVVVDSNNSIFVGGTGFVSEQYSLHTMVALRWLQNGDIDLTFSSTGFAFIEDGILNIKGGNVGVDVFDRVFIAGCIFLPDTFFEPYGFFLVVQFLSGEEIFVENPQQLNPVDFKMFYYGNNPNLFRNFLNIDFYAKVITDSDARIATLLAVNTILDDYTTVYQNQRGWNLILHAYRNYTQLDTAAFVLMNDYASSSSEIANFFNAIFGRIESLTKVPRPVVT